MKKRDTSFNQLAFMYMDKHLLSTNQQRSKSSKKREGHIKFHTRKEALSSQRSFGETIKERLKSRSLTLSEMPTKPSSLMQSSLYQRPLNIKDMDKVFSLHCQKVRVLREEFCDYILYQSFESNSTNSTYLVHIRYNRCSLS